MNEPLTEIRFWAQVLTDSERTVICSPENESRCKGYVHARGLGGTITVQASPLVPDDKLFILDQRSLDASLAQAAQSVSRPPLFRFGP